MKFTIRLLVLLLSINQYICQFKEFFDSNNINTGPQSCSRNVHCTIGQCCRGTDGRVIIGTYQLYPEIDWWRNQVGSNPGVCTYELAKEGEKCDLFCMCEMGLLCAPNVLCRTCGNICMSTEVVNKLVQYYDSGCNCVPTYMGPGSGVNHIFGGRNLNGQNAKTGNGDINDEMLSK